MHATRRDVLAGSAVALVASRSVPSQAHMGPAMASPPLLDWVFSAKVTLAPAVEKGTIDGLRKRFIAITGGDVTGPKLSGVVLPGGGDWQSIHPDGITELDARYALKANDGTVIAVTNPGIRVASPDVIKRIAAGEDVDPSLYYFRTTPRFDVAPGPHEWLRRSIFVARGVRRPDHVLIEFFRVG
jgi:Protein of unknown function (DUF3237)